MNEDDEESPIMTGPREGEEPDSEEGLDPEMVQAEDLRRAEYIDMFICGEVDQKLR
jgi:hypothetical protein